MWLSIVVSITWAPHGRVVMVERCVLHSSETEKPLKYLVRQGLSLPPGFCLVSYVVESIL